MGPPVALCAPLLLVLLAAAFPIAAAPPSCKSIPGDQDWPSEEDWDRLNRTIGGRLIATVPAASVCHTGGRFASHFDSTACAYLKPLWKFPITHFTHPAEIGFPVAQNQSCDPFTPASEPCELGNYASYSINVTGASDVAAGIKFAREKNVRLVIKNTGHDYLGKSTGKGSLSLWTHSLKSIRITGNYTGSPAHYTGPAVTLGAGVQGWEAYLAAHGSGNRIVGGSCPTVGIAGGYSMGGGHSTLSSVHGLAADNVLEWEVVTASGEHALVTPWNQNSDLYWALTGGGGGTFAVVLGMTVRLHEDARPIGGARLNFDASGVSKTAFWSAVATFHSLLPPVLAEGVSALYSITNESFSLFSLTAPDRSPLEVLNLLTPILEALDRFAVPFSFEAHSSPDFLTHFSTDLGPLPYGIFTSGQVTGSRLLPRAVLQDTAANKVLTSVLESVVEGGDFFLACEALDVSGGGELEGDGYDDNNNTATTIPGGSSGVSRRRGRRYTPPVAANAVLPAWRDAATHCIVVGPWDTPQSGTAREASASRARMEAKQARLAGHLTPLLEAATPGSGTYLNEANHEQRDFQGQFYGPNYGRLLEVKRRWDPEGLFYAVTAVGSEGSFVDGEGRLCRAEGV